MHPDSASKASASKLALAALGVVFGDIGTSPLYAFKTCFDDVHGTVPTPENVLGLLSLIFWALTAIISVKYVTIILRADNQGEGGALALMALLLSKRSRLPRSVIVMLGLFGTTLFFSDGAITPAISVLSAVEGLEVINDNFAGLVIPLVIGILVGLFAVQRRGTGSIGQMFGPVMVLWFLTLAALGVGWIAQHPMVLAALDPALCHRLPVREPGRRADRARGRVPGGDRRRGAVRGHGPLRPAADPPGLVRARTACARAQLLRPGGAGPRGPGASASPFFLMAPRQLLVPLVILSTAATVIASQAVISGVFSIAHQALQLGFLPRFSVVHSSGESIGQVFVPSANRIMLFSTIGLVLAFGSSESLAAAYGIAISLAMVIDSVLVIAWLAGSERRRERLMLAVCAWRSPWTWASWRPTA